MLNDIYETSRGFSAMPLCVSVCVCVCVLAVPQHNVQLPTSTSSLTESTTARQAIIHVTAVDDVLLIIIFVLSSKV